MKPKTAQTAYPIHELLAERWSPLSFQERALTSEELGSLLEAARWAASCFNEQPWSFLAASRSDAEGFERLASCIVPANRTWADGAGALMLSVAKLEFARNGKPNAHAWHDVGLAVGNLSAQAQSMGLAVHQMGGFDAEVARERCGIPAGHAPVAMIAIGAPGRIEDLPSELHEREAAPRARQALSEMAYGSRFGEALAL